MSMIANIGTCVRGKSRHETLFSRKQDGVFLSLCLLVYTNMHSGQFLTHLLIGQTVVAPFLVNHKSFSGSPINMKSSHVSSSRQM